MDRITKSLPLEPELPIAGVAPVEPVVDVRDLNTKSAVAIWAIFDVRGLGSVNLGLSDLRFHLLKSLGESKPAKRVSPNRFQCADHAPSLTQFTEFHSGDLITCVDRAASSFQRGAVRSYLPTGSMADKGAA